MQEVEIKQEVKTEEIPEFTPELTNSEKKEKERLEKKLK